MLTFNALRKVNMARCEEVFHSINDWSPTDWACALAGEAGKTCNAVKKLRRHSDGTNTTKDPQTTQACINSIAEELADTIIYADLLAARLGIDLGKAVCDKFNKVSIIRGASQRLEGYNELNQHKDIKIRCPHCGSHKYILDGDWDEAGNKIAEYRTCLDCGHSGPV